jgi:hypothetical protein
MIPQSPVTTNRPSVRPNRWLYAYTSDHGVTPLGGGYPAVQQSVADLMVGWDPNLYLFGGDNAYNSGTTQEVEDAWEMWAEEIDDELVIAALGNHDLDTADGAAHVAKFPYFPGNKRYFIVEEGPVAFVIINSGFSTAGAIVEPDWVGEDSTQWQALARSLELVKAKFKVAILHHSPYTSATTYTPGKTEWRLPWSKYGIDLVLSGHSHVYERLLVDTVPHIVCGTGGASLVTFTPSGSVLSQSVKRIATAYGALKITASPDELEISFRNTSNDELDYLLIKKP